MFFFQAISLSKWQCDDNIIWIRESGMLTS